MTMRTNTLLSALAISFATLLAAAAGAGQPGLTGAIYTTDSTCTDVNQNVFYADKQSVYLDGGPQNGNHGSGLPAGEYYLQITSPMGTLLGTSLGTADETPIVVDADGNFATCFQLWSLLIKASDQTVGYDDTDNNGGEYKVWVSRVANFDPSETKTDNFKVRNDVPPPPVDSHILVTKFYDANANGLDDDAIAITGWQVTIAHAEHLWEDKVQYTPIDLITDPAQYLVTESDALETNWRHTTPTTDGFVLGEGETHATAFGNLCLGAGGGHTLGFWSNKNGQALISAADVLMLQGLNLRKANGADFDGGKSAIKSWLLSATATNMAYMLSAQMAAMQLNVAEGFVSGSALVEAPGASSANALGYATISALIAEANASLGANGYTVAAGPVRSYQEALKNALDRGNNNLNFVQAAPCAFSF